MSEAGVTLIASDPNDRLDGGRDREREWLDGGAGADTYVAYQSRYYPPTTLWDDMVMDGFDRVVMGLLE